MRVHLIDGTYELFRCFYGAPRRSTRDGREGGAISAFVKGLLALLRDLQITHLACAFDHVIESFRNELYPGYKSSQGVDPLLLAQFEPAEEAAAALGIVVWPMVEFEADDALATAAHQLCLQPQVEQIILCSPDKDLQQCVRQDRIICWSRPRRRFINEKAVVQRFGVKPQSIPDWLALVGDRADGFPGLPGWGARTASRILRHYHHLEGIPPDPSQWPLPAPRATRLASTLARQRREVLLYRELATLRRDVPLEVRAENLHWRGAQAKAMEELADWLREPDLLDRVPRWQPS